MNVAAAKKINLNQIKEKADSYLYTFQSSGWLGAKEKNLDNISEREEGKGYARCFTMLLSSLSIDKEDEEICAALPRSHASMTLVDFLNSLSVLGYIGHSLKID
ncbi:MAG: hypothetical protein OEL54_06420, partial [Flavobacteriaceae bacterium]|nr:hypothetical protein [Flavobacteriaceae bacterium]